MRSDANGLKKRRIFLRVLIGLLILGIFAGRSGPVISAFLIVLLLFYLFLLQSWRSGEGLFFHGVMLLVVTRYLLLADKGMGRPLDWFFLLFLHGLWMLVVLLFSIQLQKKEGRGGAWWRPLALLYPLLAYPVMTLVTVVLYAQSYYQVEPLEQWLTALYLSAATYFTVGYGDVTPVTDVGKVMAILQMFTGGVIQVVFIPLFLTLFLKWIEGQNKG